MVLNERKPRQQVNNISGGEGKLLLFFYAMEYSENNQRSKKV